jgi:hypothetical protein
MQLPIPCTGVGFLVVCFVFVSLPIVISDSHTGLRFLAGSGDISVSLQTRETDFGGISGFVRTKGPLAKY